MFSQRWGTDFAWSVSDTAHRAHAQYHSARTALDQSALRHRHGACSVELRYARLSQATLSALADGIPDGKHYFFTVYLPLVCLLLTEPPLVLLELVLYGENWFPSWYSAIRKGS